MNLFFHLTYEDSIDIDSIKDPKEKISIESQIIHFG
jgi:factor associated with neutral sphingomyelinase activation